LCLVLTFGSNGDVPDEPQQFAPDCGYGLIFVLACPCKFHVAFVQTILRLPGDLFDFFGELEIALPAEQITANPGSPADKTMPPRRSPGADGSCRFW
jgi:hypothetical protein